MKRYFFLSLLLKMNNYFAKVVIIFLLYKK
jgi:hypothetical protein